MINFEQFKQLDIKVGTILSAEKIPDTDKLLKLEVDLGSEKRQIVSGIAEYFSDPHDVVGKQAPFVTNLEPRTIRGHESQGMILGVSGEKGFVLLSPVEEVESGAEVR